MPAKVTIDKHTWTSDGHLTVVQVRNGTTTTSTSVGAAPSPSEIKALAARATDALVAELEAKPNESRSLSRLAHWCRTIIGRA